MPQPLLTLQSIARQLKTTLSPTYSVPLRDWTPESCIKRLIHDLRPYPIDRQLIRLGPAADGGYLIADDLDETTALFSPGVSTVSGFELALAERGLNVFLADLSVQGPAASHTNFTFTQKNLGGQAGPDTITLQSWIDESVEPSDDNNLLLQMDIEGAEYETLLPFPEASLKRFRQIVIEFHHLDSLWIRPFFNIAEKVFRNLLSTHIPIHIHPNNCCGTLVHRNLGIPRVAEFTFIRRGRCNLLHSATSYPHRLDHDNLSQYAPLPLHPCWIRQPIDARPQT